MDKSLKRKLFFSEVVSEKRTVKICSSRAVSAKISSFCDRLSLHRPHFKLCKHPPGGRERRGSLWKMSTKIFITRYYNLVLIILPTSVRKTAKHGGGSVITRALGGLKFGGGMQRMMGNAIMRADESAAPPGSSAGKSSVMKWPFDAATCKCRWVKRSHSSRKLNDHVWHLRSAFPGSVAAPRGQLRSDREGRAHLLRTI